MKRFIVYIFYVFIAVALFAGCELLDEPLANNPMEIKLFARMGVHLQVKSATKAAITSTTNETLNIGVVRLDEKTLDNNSNVISTLNYPYFTNCQAYPFKATLSTPDAEEGNLRTVTKFSTSQFFKNNTDEVTYAAWYPWPVEETPGYSYSASADSTTVTFPITGESDIMYSSVVSGKMSEGFDVMQFQHALSMFRVHVYRSTELNWGNLETLTINDLPDRCKITLPKSDKVKNHSVWYSYSGQSADLDLSLNSLSVEIPVGFENKKFIQEWIAAPAPVTEGKTHLKKLDISVKAANYEQRNVTIARDFQPGYIYDIVLRFSDRGIIDAQVQVEEWRKHKDITSDVGSGGIFYNLSAYGTANCYIVSAANFGYSFDATVKGNGSTEAMPGNSIETSLDPKFVDIIWADGVTYSNGVTSTAEEGKKADFELETRKIVEGNVLFKINGDQSTLTNKRLLKEGNVLLGVYDKDYDQQDRQCLWTWHIWITDKPQDQNYTNGYIALDRNLGATAAAPEGSPLSSNNMRGLFYQWGRPTPFKSNYTLDNLPTGVTKRYTRVTPDEAVANPMVYYGRYENNTSGTAENEGVNTVPGNFHDWVDRSFKYVNNLWGYREEEHEKPIKTIYDPCPPGYHVPYARTWEKLDGFPNNMPPTNTDWPANGVNITIEGNEIWYPYQGFISKDGKYKPGHIHLEGSTAQYSKTQIVEMWSALINRHDADDIAGKLTEEEEKINDSPYRFMFNRDDHAKLSDDYTNRSRGLAVRCVSNNTADVVKDLSAYQTSNCYMIHEDGYYKFKATVRGNGVGSLLPLGGTVTAEINAGLSTTISPAKVDILWWQGDFTKTEDFTQTQNDAKPANMCLSLLDGGILCDDGFVSFKVSKFSKGNVVLAAYDEAGVILWTWHIWLTDKPEEKLSGNYTKMDRFLGATHAPAIPESGDISWGASGTSDDDAYRNATLGFYYQWGRKDPIIGPAGITPATGTIDGNSVSSAGWWMKNSDGTWTYHTSISTDAAKSIPEVVKNPTVFYKSATTDGRPDSQWFSDTFADGYTNVALWGYAVADYSIQGQTFSKTMYDPCPPGYRTPFHHAWKFNDTYRYADGENGGFFGYNNNEASFDTGNKGIVTTKTNFDRMWYPFAGMRNPTTGKYEKVGTEGFMNTGMPMRQYDTRTFWYNGYQSGQYAGGKGSAHGMMVRCMKE